MSRLQIAVVAVLALFVLCVFGVVGLALLNPALLSFNQANRFQRWTPDDAVSAFQRANLEIVNPRPMTREDFGMAPLVADQAIIFSIPSVCPTCGGRIQSFKSSADQQSAFDYYDKLGRSSAAFYSYLFLKDNILVQLNGQLPNAKANAYRAALDALK